MGYTHNSLLTVTGPEELLPAFRVVAFGAPPATERAVVYTDPEYGEVDIYVDVLWEKLEGSKLTLVFSSHNIVPAAWLQELQASYPLLTVALFTAEDADDSPGGTWDLTSVVPVRAEWSFAYRLRLLSQLRDVVALLQAGDAEQLPLEEVLTRMGPLSPEERFYCAAVLQLDEQVALEDAFEELSDICDQLEEMLAFA